MSTPVINDRANTPSTPTPPPVVEEVHIGTSGTAPAVDTIENTDTSGVGTPPPVAPSSRSYSQIISDAFHSVVSFIKNYVLCCLFSGETNGSETGSIPTPESTTQPDAFVSLNAEVIEGQEAINARIEAICTSFVANPPEEFNGSERITEEDSPYRGQTQQEAWDANQAAWTNIVRTQVGPGLRDFFEAQRDASAPIPQRQFLMRRGTNEHFRAYTRFLQETISRDGQPTVPGHHSDLQRAVVDREIRIITLSIAEMRTPRADTDSRAGTDSGSDSE